MFSKILLLLIFSGCSHFQAPSETSNQRIPKEYAQGEIILSVELLTKIFDEEMAPLSCVPTLKEAELLLRTIRPRIDVVQTEMEEKLETKKGVEELISRCDKNCTCGHLDELIREHQISLSIPQRKKLNLKKSDRELSRCLNYIQSTFCESELYQSLNEEKTDFTYEGEL